jgi:transposase
LDRLDKAFDTGIYPEFRDRTFPSLAAELQPIMSPSERSQVAGSIRAYRTLQGHAADQYQFTPSSRDKEREAEIARVFEVCGDASTLIRTQLKLRRWQAIGE